jgi:restriction system protein
LLWGKNDPRVLEIRKIGKRKDRSYKTYIENSPAETAANAIICIIHQTNYLLDQQLKKLEKNFLEKGGFTERMYHTRKKRRDDIKGY